MKDLPPAKRHCPFPSDEDIEMACADGNILPEQTRRNCDQTTLVTADNLHSLFSLPHHIRNLIFKYLPQSDLLKCLDGVPEHEDDIQHTLGRRLIRINVRDHDDPLELIRKLKPCARMLVIDFMCVDNVAGKTKEDVWLSNLPKFSKLHHLELYNPANEELGPFDIAVNYLVINDIYFVNGIFIKFTPSQREEQSKVLRTLGRPSQDMETGTFLRRLPLVNSLVLNTTIDVFFQLPHLRDYIARNDRLCHLNIEVINDNFEAFMFDIIPLLVNLKELRTRNIYERLCGIQNNSTAIKLAHMPKAHVIDTQMTPQAVGAFIIALPDSSPLRWLHVNLFRGAALLPHLPVRALKVTSMLTTICLKVTTPQWKYGDPPESFERCELTTLVQQLSILPSLRSLNLSTERSDQVFKPPTDPQLYPHDLTGDILFEHLPRLRHLNVELPCLDLCGLGSMRELVSLKLTVLRRDRNSKVAEDSKETRARESESVNVVVRDLCLRGKLQRLHLAGNYVRFRTTTIHAFRMSPITSLELSVRQNMAELVRILRYARKVKTFYNVRCDLDVWNQRETLKGFFKKVKTWNIQMYEGKVPKREFKG